MKQKRISDYGYRIGHHENGPRNKITDVPGVRVGLTGIIRAGVKGVASGFHFSEGASTITQQLLKNTVFTSWTSESSMADKFERKFQEQYLALQLEKVVDKYHNCSYCRKAADNAKTPQALSLPFAQTR